MALNWQKQIQMSKVYAGLDWSMSSPGLAIGNTNFDEIQFFGIRKKKKQASSSKQIILLEEPLYSCNAERFYKLAELYVKILLAHNVEHVFIEGYAMGAVGAVFDIGECTGIMKHVMWINGITFEPFAPTSIKKFATGKGNSKKSDMFSHFVTKTNWRMDHAIDDPIVNLEKIPSPINDCVDAYWILQYGLSLQ